MINVMLTNCYFYSRWLLPSGPPFLVRFPNPLATPQPPTRSTGGTPFQPAEDASPDYLLQCKRCISGMVPLVIFIRTG